MVSRVQSMHNAVVYGLLCTVNAQFCSIWSLVYSVGQILFPPHFIDERIYNALNSPDSDWYVGSLSRLPLMLPSSTLYHHIMVSHFVGCCLRESGTTSPKINIILNRKNGSYYIWSSLLLSNSYSS